MKAEKGLKEIQEEFLKKMQEIGIAMIRRVKEWYRKKGGEEE